MRRGGIRMRRGLAGTAAAVAAMAALTASQAPSVADAVPGPGTGLAHEEADAAPAAPNDDSYHTELPPLRGSDGTPKAGPGPAAGPVAAVHAESGIPATVLAAYRRAEAVIGRSDPGCRLPWQLLAAIGKVESGQARGGRVDAAGTTLSPILGPVLDGNGFASIPDTDGGAYDGDDRWDRAVGPMQFIPSTWARWGQDANRDGRRDPNNIHDAALAAGRYLCAGDRDLSAAGDLDRAVLSYNRSQEYLRTVLAWLAFYRQGVHPVTDGTGVLPVSPGAGGDTPAQEPVGGGEDDGEIIIGPTPGGPRPGPGPRPSPSPGGDTSPLPRPTVVPVPSPSTGPSGSPDPGQSPGPGPDPSPSPDPTPAPRIPRTRPHRRTCGTTRP
ncbi:lytic transglycosylase domain-containing protein [Streptomyces sp. t39]|uniref:lytic transglycosylase domain-containing protein n=1 Tax=Streptomyces sp. t39 TaxID=1828156 RepID=UPI0011CE496F|nr:lytic transglycosylase domain-containing protein [Streptomyces sp. t39]TXS47835.1 hypothetical protein EAO77_31585 [Streptomyces sp. t39]